MKTLALGSHKPDELVAALRAGESDVVEHLLAVHGRQIQAVAYFIVGSQADAEEVVLDTMVAAWRHSGDLRDPNALRSWLLRIATRLALSRRRRTGASIGALPDGDWGPAVTSQFSLDRLALLDALDELAPRMRAAIVLHYLVDLSVADTAAVLGRSPNTIKTQLREGLRRMREELGRQDPTDA